MKLHLNATSASNENLPKLPSLRPTHEPRHINSNSQGRASNEVWKRINRSSVQLQPRIDGWGGVGPGRWFEVDPSTVGHASRVSAVGGTCAKCGGRVRAIDLALRKRKDGSEYWACVQCTGDKGSVGGQAVGWRPNSMKAREVQREHRRMLEEKAARDVREAEADIECTN